MRDTSHMLNLWRCRVVWCCAVLCGAPAIGAAHTVGRRSVYADGAASHGAAAQPAGPGGAAGQRAGEADERGAAPHQFEGACGAMRGAIIAVRGADQR